MDGWSSCRLIRTILVVLNLCLITPWSPSTVNYQRVRVTCQLEGEWLLARRVAFTPRNSTGKVSRIHYVVMGIIMQPRHNYDVWSWSSKHSTVLNMDANLIKNYLQLNITVRCWHCVILKLVRENMKYLRSSRISS